MQVDVIVPAYNSGFHLYEALESCMQQSYKNFTVTVIDDCSTEDVKSIVDKFPSVKYIRNEKNLGPSGTRNVGINATSGELISFLDDDDVWDKDKLLNSVMEFKKNSRIGMTCGNYRILVNGRLRSAFYKRAPSVSWKTLMRINYVASGSVTVKRSVLEKVGLFDESLWIAEDYDLWLRVSEKYPIKYIHKILYYYRIIPGSDSLTQRSDIQKNHMSNLAKVKKASLERVSAHEEVNRKSVENSD
jgi:glycosyltransferase involved in cell wall biosynthesis